MIFDPDIDQMSEHQLRIELQRYRECIRYHRDQRADDRCIEDDDLLYALLPDGIKCDRRIGSPEEMLVNCKRFIMNRCQQGGPWMSYRKLELEIGRLKNSHDDLVLRNQVLRARKDLPADRLPYHDQMVALQEFKRNARVYPEELTPELKSALGEMVFRTGPLAGLIRKANGVDIPCKAEEEQAYCLHWFIRGVLEHGARWREVLSDEIDQMLDKVKKAKEAKDGNGERVSNL